MYDTYKFYTTVPCTVYAVLLYTKQVKPLTWKLDVQDSRMEWIMSPSVAHSTCTYLWRL